MSQLSPCITHFETELDDGRLTLTLKGKSLERHASELPGIVEQRFGQLQEIEAILEHLNIELKKARSASFKKFLENYNRALTSRDAEKYVDGDQPVIDLTILVNEFALLRNKYLALHKGLDTKNWMIGHITKLRCSGLEDSTID
jgi:hypothetical protein